MKEVKDFREYYDIIKTLGEGGFGIVYAAKLKNTEELRAIKVINKQKIIDSFISENLREPDEEEIKIYINSFYNEIDNMKLVEGKNKGNINAVKFHEYFENENEFCIVMELCDGNLFQLLTKKKKDEGFNKDEIYDILNQLNNTFKIMYENKLVHRDIKLQNILFKYENKEKTKYIFKLADFGISKHLLSLTQKLSTKIGTFNMMAPEILEGRPYNEKCDLWSLGIIIYLLYFHKYPYNGNNELAILNQIKDLNQKVILKTENLYLDDLISKLLDSNPNKRIAWDKYFEHPFFKEIDKSLKVVLLGETGVGKIGLINMLATHKFDPHRETSLSAQFTSKTLEFPEYGSSLKFDIWDTVGQEKYRSLAKIFYKDAKVIIFVYDITREYSFESIKNYWYEEVKNNCDNNPILAVAANNIELYNEQKVSNKEGFEFAKEIGAIFQCTSTLTDSGIKTLFYNIGKTYLTGNMNFIYDSFEKEQEWYKRKKEEEKSKNKKNPKGRMKLGIEKEKTFHKRCIII